MIGAEAHMVKFTVPKKDLLNALRAIEATLVPDFVEEWELLAADGQLNEREAAMEKMISQIYRFAHSWNPDHSCYPHHNDWRKESATFQSSVRKTD